MIKGWNLTIGILNDYEHRRVYWKLCRSVWWDGPETIVADTKFKELDEWSSLTALSIIAMVDDEYDVIIKGNDILKAETIQDLFEIVQKKKLK